MTGLNYKTVKRYWSTVSPSILGPYMMDGFGFPAASGRFRFRGECKIVDQLILNVARDGCVLDLGSGIGFWTEYFARQFSHVVAVEASEPLFQALEARCAIYQNVKMIYGDVLQFQPEEQYEVVFLGGMLMYLNEKDVISLLQKVTPSLQPGGVILCRETTVRQGIETRQGDYQAVYRSVADYERIFSETGLSMRKVRMNTPYVLMQMGCELVKKWKNLMPTWLHFISIVGRLVYWGLRLGYPAITRVPSAIGMAYPELTNHFFLLQPDSKPASSCKSSDLEMRQIRAEA